MVSVKRSPQRGHSGKAPLGPLLDMGQYYFILAPVTDRKSDVRINGFTTQMYEPSFSVLLRRYRTHFPKIYFKPVLPTTPL